MESLTELKVTKGTKLVCFGKHVNAQAAILADDKVHAKEESRFVGN